MKNLSLAKNEQVIFLFFFSTNICDSLMYKIFISPTYKKCSQIPGELTILDDIDEDLLRFLQSVSLQEDL